MDENFACPGLAARDIVLRKRSLQLIANATGSRATASMPGTPKARTERESTIDRKSLNDEAERLEKSLKNPIPETEGRVQC